MSQLFTVAVIAKQPLAGKVKTRLIGGGVSAADAAELAECALHDTLSVLSGLDVTERVLILDGSPGDWVPSGWRVQPQVPGSLDQRLAAGIAALAPGPAVLVGMDTPQLCLQDLAFDPSNFDACLGMAGDGGYWCIGFADPLLAPAAILGVPMSTSQTGAVQLKRLHALGLRVQQLPTLTDVDTPDTADEVAQSSPDSRFGLCWQAIADRKLAVSR